MQLAEKQIKARSEILKSKLLSCTLCPHTCKVNRTKGELGICKAPIELKVSHTSLHFGEEPPISGNKGSGTIFFSHCNLHCVFCQNWQISQIDTTTSKYRNQTLSPESLAHKMIDLQEQGAHNINLVSPTHYTAQIVETLMNAKKQGLTIPVVYNTNGYDSVEVIKLLDGIIDIYLPDIKYSNNNIAKKYSHAPNYKEHNQAAIKEMYSQVGLLKSNKKDIAQQGLIIRLLVLPNDLAGIKDSLNFLASLDTMIHISIMSQYNPCYQSKKFSKVNRTITKEEYDEVVYYAQDLGFVNIWAQEIESPKSLNPDFNKDKPFN